MKFKINKPPKHIRSKARRKWHEAFAWTPQKVDQTDEGHAIVWFEKYMRRERVGPTSDPKSDGRYWKQYSTKTYFKKKLNGDFDVGEDQWEGDGETQPDTNVSYQGSGQLIKKGGPPIGVNYKRYVVGRIGKDIKLCDENGDEI